MNRKIRIASIKVEGYIFKGYPGLVWHSGGWWLHDREVVPVYNNGSKSINYAGSKKSIKKLRGLAIKTIIEIDNGLPF